jgi:hypothetical protein
VTGPVVLILKPLLNTMPGRVERKSKEQAMQDYISLMDKLYQQYK